MKRNTRFSKLVSILLTVALILSLAVPALALEYHFISGGSNVFGTSDLTLEILCDHNNTHWGDNGDGTHDHICDDCGDVITAGEAHYDNDGNGLCDKCGEDSSNLLVAAIPIALPIAGKVNGDLAVPTNAEIRNKSNGRAICVKDLSVTTAAGWTLVDGNTTFTEADVDTKYLALGFRGTPVAADGSMDMSRADWVIDVDGSLPLNMDASIPLQTRTSRQGSIGTIMFTLDWASGSVDPEPDPPVEEISTAIDSSRMAVAFGGSTPANQDTPVDIQVKTMRFAKGAPENGIDISTAQDRSVLATMDDNLNGVIYLNNAYLTSTYSMFSNYNSLTSVDLTGLDTSHVTSMAFTFKLCSKLTDLNLAGIDTGNVTAINSMFYRCSSLTSLDLSGFNTSKVDRISGMFEGCSSLSAVNLSGFDTRNMSDTSGMFKNCTSLTTLDVSDLDFTHMKFVDLMFWGCSQMTTLYVKDEANKTKFSVSRNFPPSCTIIVGAPSAS